MFKHVFAAALTFGLTACGGGHGGGGKKSPHSEDAEESFVMDARDLTAVDQSASAASQGDTAGTIRLEINGTEHLSLTQASAACHTTKIDVKYADAQGLKTARLTFKRFLDTNGEDIWAPQNSASWPTLDQLRAYYSQSSTEKVSLYRVCEWMPESDDVGAGSVVVFAAQ